MDILARNIWERKWLDLWTVVHFLTGVCFGFSIFFYNSPFLQSFIVFFIFIVLWEVVEYYHQAKEYKSNQFTDIVAGALGFLITVKFLPIFAATFKEQFIYFTVIYAVTWLFAYVGFRSFAIHFHPEMLEKYKKSFYAAAFLYIVILISVMIF